LNRSDENTLAIWEKKMWRKILCPVKENRVWRILTDQELMILYRESDIIYKIRKGRLRCLKHVERMSEEKAMKQVFKNSPEGRISVGKPRKKWLYDIKIDLKKTSVRNWRKIAK
jgi:hypothetical protein